MPGCRVQAAQGLPTDRWKACDRSMSPRRLSRNVTVSRHREKLGLPMGRYIEEILQPGEKVLYSTNEHWMYFLPAIAAWVVVVAFLVLWRLVTADVLIFVCLALAAIAGVAAPYLTATAWFHRWTTETDVTNLRVVHKTGFIKRQTFEMSLDKVESVDVNQSILGRILNYGDVTVLGVGEGGKTLDTIASPLAFRNAITA